MDNHFTKEQKDIIRDALIAYCEKFSSNNKAAESLEHVSPSTVSSITRGRYDNISDDMWRNVRRQVIVEQRNDTAEGIVETTAVKDLMFCMTQNKANRDFVWAVAKAGAGKTTSTKLMRQHKNVFVVLCDEDMKKADFAQALAKAVGLRINTQKKARTVIMEVIRYLYELEDVLLIFDEGDKLADNIIYYFITIYNYLQDVVAVQFLSTPYMIKRMENGLKYNVKGFPEIWSRLGCRFYEVADNTPNDVANLCHARGLIHQADKNEVIKDVQLCDLDMRRAERKIKSIKGRQQYIQSLKQQPTV